VRFEFAAAHRIAFGSGAVREVVPAARQFGRRALFVTGRNPHRSAGLLHDLHSAGISPASFSVATEPTVELIRGGVRLAREAQCDHVIAIGGGSAIDAGKAIAALAANDGDVLDYLEVIGAGKPLVVPPLPFLAVPTTAGTGSEVTRNAVLGSPKHRVKASLRSHLMFPRLAVVDPDLTLELSPDVTASTGLDALTQLIEPYVSTRANPLTDMYCTDGMRSAAKFLFRAFQDGSDREARAGMAFASLMGGLSLANAGLGVVHGIAAPVGGMFPAPHGSVCAALLSHGMTANIEALRARAPGSPTLTRYQTVARLLTGRDDASPEDGVTWVRQTCDALKIRQLRACGVSGADIPELVQKSARASSMKANPITLSPEELAKILLGAL